MTIVFASFVLLGVTTQPLVRAADSTWREEGLIFRITELFGTAFGGNLDVPVLIVLGVLAGWLLLFCLDGTKRIQALLVVVGVGVPFWLFVEQTGRIIEAVARTPWSAFLGLAAGIGSGVATSTRLYGVKRPLELSPFQKLRWLQFPAAGGAFLYGTAAVMVAVIVDFVVTMSFDLTSLVVVSSGAIFVVSLSVFMRYDKRQTTVVVSPPDFEGEYKYQPYVLGGLYETVTLKRHGFPMEGDGELTAAKTARSLQDLERRFHSTVVFGFVSSMLQGLPSVPNRIANNWFLRTVIIESKGWTTNQIGDVSGSHDTSTLPDLLSSAIERGRYYFWQSLPLIVRRELRGGYNSVLEQLESADTILLVGPTLAEDESPPEGCEVLAALCERFSGRVGKDVILTTTQAGPVAEEEGLALESPVFKRTIAVHRLGVDDDVFHQIDVVPTDRFTDRQSANEPEDGFDDLLKRISS